MGTRIQNQSQTTPIGPEMVAINRNVSIGITVPTFAEKAHYYHYY
jgi:hypothetical protein